MLDTLSTYWWVLFTAAYVALLIYLARSGIWARHGPKIVLGTMSAIILTIPAMSPPGSYLNAVLVVVNLAILYRGLAGRQDGPQPSGDTASDRST